MNEQWSAKIIRTSNGYVVSTPSDKEDCETDEFVLEENDGDPLRVHEELLWELMDYFHFGGSKHDKERIRVIREKGEDYEPRG